WAPAAQPICPKPLPPPKPQVPAGGFCPPENGPLTPTTLPRATEPSKPPESEKDETQSIYKAPQPGKGKKMLKDGFHPRDFRTPGGNDSAYFAKDRSLADEYARHYCEGVIEIVIPQDIYDSRLRRYEQLYQGGPRIELKIPTTEFDLLNDMPRILHE
ncbi:MAG: hypothetical protein ACRDD1_15745, partial [Planctomycetia bacterium]